MPKEFRLLLAAPLLLLLFTTDVKEKTVMGSIYELVCFDLDVALAINELENKITYWTIEVVQNPGSINTAKTRKKIKRLKGQVKCLSEIGHVKQLKFLFEGDALKKDQSVAAYQGRSQCFKEIDDAREESMKTTISQIYFGEEFKVDRKNLVGTDNEGIKYQCELNDVSVKYAL